MYQTLCNWTPSPTSPSSWGAPRASQPIHSEPLLLLRPTGSRSKCCKGVRASAVDVWDDLDHWQRSLSRPQLPSRRVDPAVLIDSWDSFFRQTTVHEMMETMDMMEDPFIDTGRCLLPSLADASGLGRGRTPWAIKEGMDEYKMRFDMPGMTKEDVKVRTEEKMLIIKAEKLCNKQTEEGEDLDEEEVDWSANSYGRYSSRIELPEKVQFEKIRAEVRDGVLCITIPKHDGTRKILDINVQ